MIGKLALINIPPGAQNEVRGGVYRTNPRVYGRLADDGCSKDVAYVVMHPTNNFMGHYLLEPMQKRGRAILALNSRFVGNDSNLIVERVIQDLGAGVRFLREQGYRRICLIGNSGGGAIAALYQAEAENLTITETPDGTPIALTPADLPPVDSIALIAAAPGRAFTYTLRLDAAVIDEADILATDPDLDIFNPANGPPFSAGFLQRVEAAQFARNRRITDWCLARLRMFRAMSLPVSDQGFVVHRTNADPRHLDLGLDANDRKPGDPWETNYSSNGLGRYTTLRSWLSQWSVDHSRAKGPECLERTSVPVLMAYFTADSIVLPSYYAAWEKAAGARGERVDFKGVPHYPHGHPQELERLADLLADWGARH